MLTVLSMLVGFISSLAPEFLKRWQDKADKSHELALLEMQMKQAENVHMYRMDEIGVQAYGDIVQSAHRSQDNMLDKASRWVIDFTSSVRPVITYLFMIAFIGFKMAIFFAALNPNFPWQESMSFAQAMTLVWDDEDKAIFAGIIAYWFGDRGLIKNRK
jgi:hypothetical protein